MRIKAQNGFTLTELMVSMAIFTIIIAGLCSTLLVGNISWEVHAANANTQNQARITIETMARDLRVAQGLLIIQDADNVAVTFSRPGVGNVTYAWSTSGASPNQVIHTTDTATRIVARDISALSLADSVDDVTINVTANILTNSNKNIAFGLISKVAKR